MLILHFIIQYNKIISLKYDSLFEVGAGGKILSQQKKNTHILDNLQFRQQTHLTAINPHS